MLSVLSFDVLIGGMDNRYQREGEGNGRIVGRLGSGREESLRKMVEMVVTRGGAWRGQ